MMSPLNTSKLLLALLTALPAIVLRLSHLALSPEWSLLVFGSAVLASAFLLTWAAECAQKDISGSLAIAILALIAVLPEYAIDLYFAYSAGSNPAQGAYAIANMTGSNRLLLGLGWPVVVGILIWKSRKGGKPLFRGAVSLSREMRFPILILAAASIYAFLIPVLGRVSLMDSAILFSLFGIYLWQLSKAPKTEPHLIGVAEAIASLNRRKRITSVTAMFVIAAASILSSAEPFAESLIRTGKNFGINEFLLVQWLAPFASEAPEFLVAIMLALRSNTDASFGTLLSSKINQWTLLVGGIPIAYLMGGGGFALVLDPRQTQEVLLTAAQSIFGLAVVINLKVSALEALLLLFLFFIQFVVPGSESRTVISSVYIALAILFAAKERRATWTLYGAWLNPWKTSKTSPLQ